LAATAFFKTGRTDVAEIKVAHELLPSFLGTKLAPILFAIALIASDKVQLSLELLQGKL
jgi:manganese transport protein